MGNDPHASAGKPDIGAPTLGVVETPKPEDKPEGKGAEQTIGHKDEQASDAPKQD